jgi:hypothetical protein
MATHNAPRAYAITNCTVADFSLDAEELAFLGLINQYRQDNGLNALTISTNLNRAAHWMAWDLGTTPNWSHTDSLGRSPYQRAIDCGYPQGAGENLAAGSNWSTAQSAFNAWKNSAGHNANMLNSFYRQIGIARVHVPGSPYGWYWVTNFGSTDDGTGGGGGGTPPTATPTQPPPTNTPMPVPTQSPPTATPTTPPSQGFSPPSTPTPVPTKTPTPTAPSASGSGSNNQPQPTSTQPPGSLALKPGSNLIGWTGDSGKPDVVLKDVKQSISIVYGWDTNTGTWVRYAPGLPSYANTLTHIAKGSAYWIITE